MSHVEIRFNKAEKAMLVDGVDIAGVLHRATVDCERGKARLHLDLLHPDASLNVTLDDVELTVMADVPDRTLAVLKALAAKEGPTNG